MHIARSCLRCSLVGGSTDIPSYFNEYGGLVIGFAINQYAYITCRRTPRLFDYKTSIHYSKTEQVLRNQDIKHDGARGVLEYLGDNTGYDISCLMSLPARTGTGSSSAFVVAMLKVLWTMKGVRHDRYLLAKTANYIERILLKEAGGWQDAVFAAYGNFNVVKFENNDFKVYPINVNVQPLLDRMVLLYTGQTRMSFELAESYENPDTIARKHAIKSLAECGLLAVENGDWDVLASLMNQGWLEKRGISSKVSNSHIDDIYQRGMNQGAVAAKLLGSGGSGFMLFILEEGADREEFTDKMGLHRVEFEVDYDGASVVL